MHTFLTVSHGTTVMCAMCIVSQHYVVVTL